MSLASRLKGLFPPTLFLKALQLSLMAQGIRRQPLLTILVEINSQNHLPLNISPRDAQNAVEVAGSILKRFGLLNTCLTRSLAISGLLSDHDNLMLHIGFRPGTPADLQQTPGHAWLTLDGVNVTDHGLPDPEHTFLCPKQIIVERTPNAQR